MTTVESPAINYPAVLGVLRGMLDDVTGRELSPVFVGRETQLALLQNRLGLVKDGQSGVVLIGGEAGVGKTRLVEEFTREASHAGIDVLWGGCFDLGDDALPFAPFSAALRQPMRAAGVSGLVELAGGDTTDRVRLYEAVADLIEQAGTPDGLVLVLEDLHWSDRSTRELLGFLARTMHDSSVLVVGTYRSDEMHRAHPLRPFVAELERVRIVEHFELPRLDRDQVGEQLTGLLGREPEANELDQVYSRSEGNPFFVEELTACSTSANLPRSLQDLMLVRVERLDPHTQRVLRAASVIGVTVPHRLLAAILDEPEQELLASLQKAVDNHLLVIHPDDESYVFRHSLLRESLHTSLLPGEHTSWHASIAAALVAQPSLVSRQGWAIGVAHHWNAAHDQPRALAAAFRAAEVAQQTHAYAEQLAMLERVLSLWEVVPDAAELIGTDLLAVTMLATKAASAAAEPDRANALASVAVELALQQPDVERQAAALIQRGKWWASLGKYGREQDLRQAVALLPPEPTVIRSRALDALATVLMLDGRDEESEQLAREALEVARAVNSDIGEISALTTLATVVAPSEHEGIGLAREALRIAKDTGNQRAMSRVLTNLSHIYSGLGRHEEALATARQGLEVVHDLGLSRTGGPVLAGNVADPLIALGRLDEAERVIADAVSQGPGLSHGGAYLSQLSGWLLLLRGDIDAAEAAVNDLEGQYPEGRLLPQDALPLTRLRATIALSRGNSQGAFDLAAEPLRESQSAGHARYLWPLAVLAAEALADTAERARDLRDESTEGAVLRHAEWLAGVGELLPDAGAAGNAWRCQLKAELYRAGVVTGSGEVDQVELWQEVAATYAKIEEPWPQGGALLRAAEVAAATGDRDQAGRLTRVADALAQEMGCWLLARNVAGLARRARIELPDGTTAERAVQAQAQSAASQLGLTEREVEVLRGVAAGQTNRQIAEQLFMSPKTASVHVSNILTKLDVRSRGEAAAVAHRLRLFEA